MTLTDRIEVNPRILLGKAIIRGTRIPVELLLRKLNEGASAADLFDAYPRLTRDDIHAAMRYAADTLAHEEVVFIGKDSTVVVEPGRARLSRPRGAGSSF